ncbi:MAG: hypothetical protein ACFFDK_15155 [Promethearchaeota archaeon]
MDNEDESEDVWGAPVVPPPRKTTTIPLDSEELSPDLLKKIEKIDPKDIKPVIIKCERCDKNVLIPIPIEPVLESEKREVLINYVHKNNKNNDKHCLVFEVDHDFNILLPKAIDVIISTVSTPKKADDELKKSSAIRHVIIKCDKCNENIHVPVPRKIIEESKLPKTPVTYVHKSENCVDPHSVVLYLDNHFHDRDTRFPDILILYLFPYWLKKNYCFTE